MIKRLRFAFTYALRSLLRSRQRTLFALLSVAAGVSTVVALRSLGLMLTDTLTSNAQAFLRADIRVYTRGNELRLGGLEGNDNVNQRQPAYDAQTIAECRWPPSPIPLPITASPLPSPPS
jgi:hypothetical protein